VVVCWWHWYIVGVLLVVEAESVDQITKRLIRAQQFGVAVIRIDGCLGLPLKPHIGHIAVCACGVEAIRMADVYVVHVH